MKSILIILPYLPYPLDCGGNNVIFSIIDQLRKDFNISIALNVRSHSLRAKPQEHSMKYANQLKERWKDVTFHLYYGQAEYSEEPFSQGVLCRMLRYIGQSVGRKYRRAYSTWSKHNLAGDIVRAKSLLTGQHITYNPGFVRFVKDIAQKGYDIIQVEMYEYLFLGYVLPKDVKKVFIHHELRFIRNKNELSLFKEQNPNDQLIYEQQKAAELAALSIYDHIITLTETDRSILAEYLPIEKITASPVNLSASPEQNDKEFCPCSEFVFVGSGSHYPNQDAMIWFASEILPLLREKMPQVRLHVVGRWSKKDKDVIPGNNPEIIFEGFVDDLSSFINGKISIIPLRIGSGLRVKILEAIEAKSPFITTMKGVEGLEFQPANDYLLAPESALFAESMARLAYDTDLQRSLAENAMQRKKELYSTEKLYEIRKNCYLI